jgi:uncharacterized protein (TIGR03086 family)
VWRLAQSSRALKIALTILTVMDALAAHRSALRQFDNRVQLIADNQWHNPTPNTDWDVTDLVRHLVYEQLWVPPLLAGRTIAEVGDAFEGDVLGDDPKGAWSAAAAAAQAAFNEAGALDRQVHLSFGDVPAPEYLWQLIVDLVAHAWDLAQGIKASDHMPNDLVAATLGQAREVATEFAGSGLFAPPIAVPGCTDDLTELLALLGRAR